MRLLVLKHVSHEGLGAWEPVARCLGAQLLAHGLGGAIFANPGGREVGVSAALR